MRSFKLLLLFLCVSSTVLYKTTHAKSLQKSNITDFGQKEHKTVIELNKDITVNTGLNFDRALAELNGTEASNIVKIRKVSDVSNDSLERKLKSVVNSKNDKNVSTTTIGAPLNVSKLLTTEVITAKGQESNRTADLYLSNSNNFVEKQVKNSSNISTTKSSSGTITITTTKPTLLVANNSTTTNITGTVPAQSFSIGNTSKSTVSSTTSTTTTTTSSTTTTTTTSTPKPKKPTVTYSIPDFPDLEKDNPELKNLLQSSVSNKLPIPDGPYAQPSQEFNSHFHHSRDLILPVVSMIFIIPLIIGILTTSYRRFRDCWSTRHYRRMDFLVDGMYND